MSPPRLARKEPNLCDFNALNMAGYRCFSGVRWPDQGPQRKSNVLYYFFNRPWSWWVPGCRSTKGLCQTLEIPGAEKPKGLLPRWWVILQKTILFCDGQVFFIDRGLLMGAFIHSLRFGQFNGKFRIQIWILKSLIKFRFLSKIQNTNWTNLDDCFLK